MKTLSLVCLLMGALQGFTQQFDSNPEIILVDVDCSESKEILEEAFEADLSNPTDANSIARNIDHENQARVVSLLEKMRMAPKIHSRREGNDSCVSRHPARL